MPIFRHLSNIPRLGGNDDRGLFAKPQVETYHQRIEEVFSEIETAFALRLVFKIAIPFAGFPQLGSVVGQVQRWKAFVGSEGRQSRSLFDGGIDAAIFVSGAVIVAKGNQRPDFQQQILRRFRVIVFSQFVLHDGAVLAVDHENGLLDLNAFDFVGENRKWIEAELLEMSKALLLNSAWVTVCGEVKRLSVDEQRLLHL